MEGIQGQGNYDKGEEDDVVALGEGMMCKGVEWVWTKSYKNLQSAVDEGGYVYAEDWGLRGAKKFTRVTMVTARKRESKKHEQEATDEDEGEEVCAKLLLMKDHHAYEVLKGGRKSRLFLDVEWPRMEQEKEEDEEGRRKMKLLFGLLETYCSGWTALKERLVFCSHRKGKISYHVLFPNAVLDSVEGEMKELVLGFVYWLHEKVLGGRVGVEEDEVVGEGDTRCLWYEKAGKGWSGGKRPSWNRCIIDTLVYTPNRCFRLPLQSKLTDETHTKLEVDPYLSRGGGGGSGGGNGGLHAASSRWFVQGLGTVDREGQMADEVAQILKRRRVAVSVQRYPCAYRMLDEDDQGVQKTDSKHKAVGENKKTKKKSVPMTTVDQKKKTQTITLASNDDMLTLLNPEELKMHGFAETYLPILAELVKYFGRKKVLDWMGDDSKPKYVKLVNDATKFVLPTTCGGGKLHFKMALDYLKRTYKKVNDVRPDGEMFSKMPQPNTVEPTKEDGWTFVSKTELASEQALAPLFSP